MKKNIEIGLIVLFCGLMSFNCFSDNFSESASAVMSENQPEFYEAEIYNSFKEVDGLTDILNNNDRKLSYENSTLLASVSSGTAIAFSGDNQFSFTKNTAFLMGCCFGAIGILVVAVVNNGDTPLLNNAIWGCVTSGAVYSLTAVLFYVLFYSNLMVY